MARSKVKLIALALTILLMCGVISGIPLQSSNGVVHKSIQDASDTAAEDSQSKQDTIKDNMSLSELIQQQFKGKIQKRKVKRNADEVAKYIIKDSSSVNKKENY